MDFTVVKDFITANDASNLVGDRECVLGLRGVIIQYLELESRVTYFMCSKVEVHLPG
jgi:hypothetical protein